MEEIIRKIPRAKTQISNKLKSKKLILREWFKNLFLVLIYL